MRVQVCPQERKSRIKYPVIMCHKDYPTSLIVLFDKVGRGTVLASHCTTWEVGKNYSPGFFMMGPFEPYCGELILSNE